VAGRFPLYTDADIRGPFVDALIDGGWDVKRAVKAEREGTLDSVHFDRAVREGRVLVTNDHGLVELAIEWARAERRFPGLVTWTKYNEKWVRPGEVLRLFEELAAQDDPFAHYSIVWLRLGLP
jgi:hypothetical protein